MSNIIFYSTHCPQCKILEKKMIEKGIKYTEVNDLDEIMEKGIRSVPMLEVNDKIMNFISANQWINNYKQEN